MKRNHLFLVSLFLCMGIRLIAQNPLTILAPKYIKNSVAINLPNGPGTNDYHGAKAEFASNAFPDAQGDLKFFIVDQFVYDSQGYLLEDLSSGSQVGNIQGRSEIAVFKDPGNCEKFYVFSSGQSIGGAEEYRQYVLDFTQVSNENPSRMGYLSVDNTFIPPSMGGGGDGNAHWAITKPRTDGSHFVFVSRSTELNIYKVDNLGFSYVSTVSLNFNSDEINYLRGEMEVFEFPDANQVKYKVAFPYFRNGTPSDTYPSYHVVGTFDFNASGTIIGSNNFLYPLVIANNDTSPFIYGLEFDPTGRYLFITHDANSAAGYNTGIDYIDFNNSTPAITPLNVPGNLDFQNSQIEYLNLNNIPGLYMANATSFGRIIPNSNPASITVQTNVFGTGVAANYMYKDQLPNYPEYMNYKQFVLPDQIDGYNYRDFYIEPNDITCCNLNTNFDKTSFTASTNATWTSGSNPLAANGNTTNTVTIRDELRIPRGKVITIQNMILKFAPDAKLIIEEGNSTLDGGKLVLDNSTLTVDQRCSNDMLWQGVEVWGIGNVTQGALYGSSQQGRLFVQNNSIIEYAKRGVLLTIIDANGVYSSTKSGGILIANSSTFRNNQRDVIARNYVSPTGANNLSALVDCNFLITEPLKGGAGAINRVEFYNMKGMTVSGCTFKITEPTLLRSSYGIFSRNTTFSANARCTSGTVPCSSYDPNIFENLSYGIYVTNTSSSDAFSADRNTFINNNIGIRASSVGASVVTRNSFRLFESTSNQTSGLYLTGSTGYTVQENNFGISNAMPLTNARTYGIVVSGSGIDANLIYNNSFTKLYVGGQSEGINASTVLGDASGLVWKCNTFLNPIAGYDLTVMNGRIGYNQGYTDPSNATLALQKAANNKFSLTGESSSSVHDYFLSNSQTINYVYTTSTTTIPDAYTASLMTIQQSIAGSPLTPVQYTSAGCPSLLSGGKFQIKLPDLNQLEVNLLATQKMMQSETSPELETEISLLKNQIHQSICDQLSAILLEQSDENNMEKAIELLIGRPEKVYQRMLLDLYITMGDIKSSRELLTKIGGNENIDVLNRIRVDMMGATDYATYLSENGSDFALLQMIASDKIDPICSERAMNLLSEINGVESSYSFIVAKPDGTSLFPETDLLSVGVISGNSLVVYPNPTEGNIIVENLEIKGNMQLVDVTGKVVLNQRTTDQRTVLDMSSLKEGVYILIVTDEISATQFTKRVVKR